MTAIETVVPPRDSRGVDPDPFVAVSTFFDGAAVVLTLVMVWQTYGAQKAAFRDEHGRRNRLNSIEAELSQLRVQLRRVTRAVDRGSRDSDRQFYDAPYRLHASRLEMAAPDFQEFAEAVSHAFMRCGNLSNWIHNIINHDPELASDLGELLTTTVGDVVAELNRTMAEGRPNRTVITEANRVLDALGAAIDRELGNGNS